MPPTLYTFPTTVFVEEGLRREILLDLRGWNNEELWREFEDATITCCFHVKEEQTPIGLKRYYDDIKVVGAVTTNGDQIKVFSPETAKDLADRYWNDIIDNLELSHYICSIEGNAIS
jgi:hypothetical protein